MKRMGVLKALLIVGMAAVGRLESQVIVFDPQSLAKMVEKFTQELKHWEQQVQQWGKQSHAWAAELEHFGAVKAQWEKENKLFQKMLKCSEDNLAVWGNFLGGVRGDFNWEELRLKEVMDLLAIGNFVFSSGSDPYLGLFSKGMKIEEVFPQIRDWSDVKMSVKYKNNTEYRAYIDSLIESQKKMLDDLENKIKVIAQLNNLVPEREKKMVEIQKRLEECAKVGVVNLPSLWVLSSEVCMELCREMFHLVTLNRIETENMVLAELRSLSEKKLEDQLEDKTKSKDKQVVTELLTGSKGVEK